MSRSRKDPLRPLTPSEHEELNRLAQSRSDEAARVARAKELLAVAHGMSYQKAAHAAGRKNVHAVSDLVSRFNRLGLDALETHHAGGKPVVYGTDEKERILREWARKPSRKKDGTATWSIDTLRQALHKAADGLPDVSHDTIWQTLHEAGLSWQKDRSWEQTGKVLRKRKDGIVEVVDKDASAKKNSSKRPTRKPHGSASTSGLKTKPAHSRHAPAPATTGAP